MSVTVEAFRAAFPEFADVPDAAVAGYRSLSFEFVPDESSGTARLISMPPLSGLEGPSTIRLPRGWSFTSLLPPSAPGRQRVLLRP